MHLQSVQQLENEDSKPSGNAMSPFQGEWKNNVHADVGENIMTACQAVSVAEPSWLQNLNPLAATASSNEQR